MMKKNPLALALSLITASAVSVSHAATDSGVVVSNQASITSYSVGGVAQTTAINSDPVRFLVDRKVNVTVTGGTTVLVAQSATKQVLTFTVTNNSNSVSDFKLDVTNASGDDFDASNFFAYVDADPTDGGYNSTVDTAVFIDELGPDLTKTVYVVSDIPATATNNQLSNVVLKATSHMKVDGADNLGGVARTGVYVPTPGSLATTAAADTTSETDSPTKVQTVLADIAGVVDNARDAAHSAQTAYQISAATLRLNETVVTVWDPLNNLVNPKAIPGAVVKYCVTVFNEGAMAANGVKVETTLPSDTTWYATSVDSSLVPGVTTGDGNTCGATAHATSKGAYDAATNKITVQNLDLNPGTAAVPTYQWIQFYAVIK